MVERVADPPADELTGLREWSTPPQAARWLGLNGDKIRTLIHRGEIRAVNVAIDPHGRRPKFRIHRSDLLAFLARRAVLKPPRQTRRAPRPRDEHIIE